MGAVVTAVSRSATHTLSKRSEAAIKLLAGLVVAGDSIRVQLPAEPPRPLEPV